MPLYQSTWWLLLVCAIQINPPQVKGESGVAPGTAAGNCRLPEAWSGQWFQSEMTQLLTINSTSIETKGPCIENDGDKYILEDKKDQCFRCVVIHEKHHNVLQYKETYCEPRRSLEQLCGEITGDAILYSMFRSNAAPVPCPFKGPFSFTYNRGSGECARPPSRIDSCAEDSRLRMHYQACADVLGTESSSEELECLATWKDGNTRYLVGKLAHKMANSDEDRYRCFVYERASHEHSPTFRVAQSGDATCNGLLSATEGSRTMRLTKETHASQCKFPSWVTDHHHWHSLDQQSSILFSHKNATLRISEQKDESRALCHSQIDANDNFATLVVHLTRGCASGFVCMLFHRRDAHVIEMQQSMTISPTPEEACHNFESNSSPLLTLTVAALKPRKCPHPGRYTVRGSSATSVGDDCEQELVIGCKESHNMEFRSVCASENFSAFSCHGSWHRNGTHYLLASPLSRHSTGSHRSCFVYAESERGLHFFSVPADSCERAAAGSWAFNITMDGPCEAEISTESSASRPTLLLLLLLALLVFRLPAR